MKLIIESMAGVWRGQSEHRSYFADTLEELLLQLAPDAPEEYVWHAAEVLGAILGAEVVELVQLPEGVYDNLEDFLASLDPGIAPDYPNDSRPPEDVVEENEAERWQPTEEQQAYFEPERTEEAESFDPDTQPRGV